MRGGGCFSLLHHILSTAKEQLPHGLGRKPALYNRLKETRMSRVSTSFVAAAAANGDEPVTKKLRFREPNSVRFY
jgi:hypothetical protein